MRIFSVMIFNGHANTANPEIVSRNEDLSPFGWFSRGLVRETVVFVSHEVAARTFPGDRNSVFRDMPSPVNGVSRLVAHCYTTVNKVSYVVITDGEYPARTAHLLGHKSMQMLETQHSSRAYNRKEGGTQIEVKIDGLDAVIAKYQDPKEADPIAKINKDLEDTKEIMIQNIEKLLKRGEDLDALLSKTTHLSESSKIFLKKTEKLNSCRWCTIL
eukprot:TRINITY_DN524_c0_g1_i1.p1 TRINITY_DN524_c0_g1~~TRINITY_DN524_c0_g1_i1.p1  ORF type:complete len:215 (+),score=60.57 TRINITY_DN524_c0_g1_i1:56-700(+)